MQRHHLARPVLASFVSGAVALLPWLTMALLGVSADDDVSGDDAALRGAAMVLMGMPVLYIGTVLMTHVAGSLLVRWGCTRLRAFVGTALIVSVALATLSAVLACTPGELDVEDMSLAFASTFVAGSLSSLAAACCWWWLAAVSRGTGPDSPDA